MKVLVTGATGFVGRRLAPALVERGHEVSVTVRRGSASPAGGLRAIPWLGAELRDGLDPAALVGLDAVVHLAGLAHVTDSRHAADVAAFEAANLRGSLAVAEAARAAGVPRFIFMSSLHVHGDGSDDRVVTEDSPFRPLTAYASSKLRAEEALVALEARGGPAVTVLRPPLVYGPGVGANFARLMAAVARGLPMPFGGVDNRRSLVYRENLIELIALLVARSDAPSRVYLACDEPPISTEALVRALARHLDRPARLIPVPHRLLLRLRRVPKLGRVVQQLYGSFEASSARARDELGWRAPHGIEDALATTVKPLQTPAQDPG
jgi:nucleoside-diphosphate-sugar epimerase